jgi:hypothetical protein
MDELINLADKRILFFKSKPITCKIHSPLHERTVSLRTG